MIRSCLCVTLIASALLISGKALAAADQATGRPEQDSSTKPAGRTAAVTAGSS